MRLGQIAIAARLLDLGFKRNFGETRLEYRRRLEAQIGLDVYSSVEQFNVVVYAPSTKGISKEQAIGCLKRDLEALTIFPLWRRATSFLNPASIFNALIGRRW